jgi:hypothetical protein
MGMLQPGMTGAAPPPGQYPSLDHFTETAGPWSIMGNLWERALESRRKKLGITVEQQRANMHAFHAGQPKPYPGTAATPAPAVPGAPAPAASASSGSRSGSKPVRGEPAQQELSRKALLMGELLGAMGGAAGAAPAAAAAADPAAMAGAAAAAPAAAAAAPPPSKLSQISDIWKKYAAESQQQQQLMPDNNPGVQGAHTFAQLMPELLGSVGANYLGRLG